MYRIYQFDKRINLVDSVRRRGNLKIYSLVFQVDHLIEIFAEQKRTREKQ